MSPSINPKTAASAALLVLGGAILAEPNELAQASFSEFSSREPKPQVRMVSIGPVEDAYFYMGMGLRHFVSKPEELKAYAQDLRAGHSPDEARRILAKAVGQGLISEDMSKNLSSNPDPKVREGALSVLNELARRPDLVAKVEADRTRIVSGLKDSSLITSAEVKILNAVPVAALYNLADLVSAKGDLSKVQRREMHTAIEVYRIWGEGLFGSYFSQESGHAKQLEELSAAPLMTRILGAVALNNKMSDLRYRGADAKGTSDGLSATLAEVMAGR